MRDNNTTRMMDIRLRSIHNYYGIAVALYVYTRTYRTVPRQCRVHLYAGKTHPSPVAHGRSHTGLERP